MNKTEQKNQEDVLLVISKTLADAIYTYLNNRPFIEVRSMVQNLESIDTLENLLDKINKQNNGHRINSKSSNRFII